ncbi:hypothetical protein HMPREF9123_2530 [Neisseria bacilliformis ATCC BAA-1200]|uniref:Uncharacterized protein n=1 Tax=Neisseria bacilliformis ATCC BAA-1200 TaxID=888742 RepID=F2BFM3_9NEIS|nr:hypothetical protein HMPREF9123_2530 [Neisseria bacilliformis ATCC BAA-1200]
MFSDGLRRLLQRVAQRRTLPDRPQGLLTISLTAVFLAKNTRLPRQKTVSQAKCQQTLTSIRPSENPFSDGLCL